MTSYKCQSELRAIHTGEWPTVQCVAVEDMYETTHFVGKQCTNKFMCLQTVRKQIFGVRFQVLTAASLKFRFVFWDVLPCKIIVDRRRHGSTSQKTYLKDIWCFLFSVGYGTQDAVFAILDVFLNTASACHELPPRKMLRMWTSENILTLDILQPIMTTSKSRFVL
jgi:hypothetical protein